jgi:TRAP-type C4-dicarboxylate transport system permease small subunit
MASEGSPARRVLAVLHRIEDALLALIFAGLMILAFAQVILRNLFDEGLVWSDPVLRVMVLWVGLLAALVASRDDRHIAIDLLTRWVGERPRAVLGVLTAVFTAGVCALIAWHGARLVASDREAGIELSAGLPAWVFELIIPLSFGLIAVRYVVHAVLRSGAALGKRDA